ncbi:MAG TPA: FAD-dependent oxidoreductase, partial [Solirubrobacteraceae bacterium]|nr:FAD-dependent oxidoreductase [Solirubrobacteraceae bacterium]
MSDESPIRIAVVGSGPAGFYAAGHLLKDSAANVEVDMIERLPTPWGLVRSGVAPDHPKIKTVSRVYEKTAEHPRFRFFGNVCFGQHVSREDLLEHYHAIVYATGSAVDRPLGIPGEELQGSHAATDFVGWYNGHPDQTDLEVDLLSAERALVIGNGNVALDLARMLVLGSDELAGTDTADHALAVLGKSSVREVVVAGRRGPAQAAFTNPELRELAELAEADVIVDPAELERALAVPDPALEENTIARQNVEILRQYAAREPAGKPRRIVMRFLLSPERIIGDENGRVAGVELVRNELVPDESGTLRALATDERETIETGLVFRAIGYRGLPLPGVPFDERRGVIPNADGRVTDPATGAACPGEYVVGWIKRGPTGVIGTNKKDAQQTVDAVLADLASRANGAGGTSPEAADAAAIERLLLARQPQLVPYAGWQEIDRHERAHGEREGRPRVKLTRIDEMLRVAA